MELSMQVIQVVSQAVCWIGVLGEDNVIVGHVLLDDPTGNATPEGAIGDAIGHNQKHAPTPKRSAVSLRSGTCEASLLRAAIISARAMTRTRSLHSTGRGFITTCQSPIASLGIPMSVLTRGNGGVGAHLQIEHHNGERKRQEKR
jgi:hypothetical protein